MISNPCNKPSNTPSLSLMKAMMRRAGINLQESQWQKLWRYHNLLRERNQDRDLTRIIGFEAMVIKHYIDCMIVGDLLTIPSPIADLGSGAGFPGIPLKIRYPKLQITLAEPRPRRVSFLLDAIKLLNLKGIDVFPHKVVSQSFTRPVAAVISRAVEEIEKTLLRTQGCIGPGSRVIFMKGPNVSQEMKSAEKRLKTLFTIEQDIPYLLPGTKHQRRLVVYRKN